MDIKKFIKLSIEEDCHDGDHTSLACIHGESIGRAKLLVKEGGIIAGVELAEMIFNEIDANIKFNKLISDGQKINKNDIVFTIEGSERNILKSERLVLNCMQRMSGIATITSKYVAQIKDLNTKILDTRKTTPLNRAIEKWAVKIGGGYNHRFGLFDMILIKDNHIDYCGGVEQAINATNNYLKNNNLDLKIEIETRSLAELEQVLKVGSVNRIMLDNFDVDELKHAVEMVNNKYETEASGGITLETIRSYALTGVDFISVGALTHSVKSIDLSLKAE